MVSHGSSRASRLLAASREHATGVAADSVVAYLLAWAAAEILIRSLAWEAGVRPTFSLRRNGTVRTHRVGELKMPDVIPPSGEHQLREALGRVPDQAQRALVLHPSVEVLASRAPTLNGRRLASDSFGQPLRGVLDLALTRDVRCPVWRVIDGALLAVVRDSPRVDGALAELACQVGSVLSTIHSNLLVQASDEDEVLARLGLPLARLLVEAWLAV